MCPVRTLHILFGLTFILSTWVVKTSSIKWLALAQGKQAYWNQTSHCMRSRQDGLVKNQVRICKNNMELMDVVSHATRETMIVCQELFSEKRWNCSSVTTAPNYMNDLTGGSREQAFIYALSSAALTQAISKACSIGLTTKCSCGRLPSEAPPAEFKWGGCGDDLQFGIIFSGMFADAPYTERKKSRKSKKNLVNMHNNGAGRTIVANSLQTACKCHGVSGSCSIKTCWKALPQMKSIGTDIQKKYGMAIEVDNKKINKRRALVPVSPPGRREFHEDELIYYTKSPDYCLPDKKLGSLGTRGRECKKNDPGSGGCQSMCCGRGFTGKVVQIQHRCDCKYYWCCYVKCKTCTKQVEINRCR